MILEDVSAEELGPGGRRRLEEAVRDQALGFLALGGDHSFSLGKYYKSPLQEVLPVKSLVPGKLQRKNVAIELVLDRSGSMINEVGGVPKIAMAQAAARGALGFLLKHRDQVGIVPFEIKPKALVPLTRVEPGNVGRDRSGDQPDPGQRRDEHLQGPRRRRRRRSNAPRPRTATSSCSPTGSANRAPTGS